MEKSQESNDPESRTDQRTVKADLEEIVNQMGEDLHSIPQSSAFGDQEYADTVVWSNETQNANFGDSKCETPRSREHHQPEQMALATESPKRVSEPMETDLYPFDPDFFSLSSLISSESRETELQNSTSQSTSYSSQRKYRKLSESLSMLPQVTQFIEPPYEAFICPLTKEIMEDPVTLETGLTCERKAITEWIERFGNSEEIQCPITGQKLKARLSTNITLKIIIDEWKVRNETGRIKVAHAALSLAGSQSMVIEAMKDLKMICKGKEYNKVQVREDGMLQLLNRFLVYRDKDVRYEVLELLRILAEDDNGKEMIAKAIDFSRVIKFLPSTHREIRHAAMRLLLELSKNQHACEKIGMTTGGILMLITSKYNREFDPFASEAADEILKHLEKFPDNIKCMAENGLLEPILNHLAEGEEDTKMVMATSLAEIVIGDDRKAYVAEKACPSLIKLVQSENTEARRVAFKSLAQISLHHPNSQMLLEAGIVKIMVEELFTKRTFSELLNSRKEAAETLANILESGMEHEFFQATTQGHILTSDYFIYNIIHMLKNSTPDELNISLIRILLSLSKSSKAMANILSVVKETDASFALIELINNPHEDLGIAATKLLIVLSPCIGHTLSERLCKIQGLPENLICCPKEANCITEKHAVSAKFLTKLPHQNLTLNLALVSQTTVSAIIDAIHLVQRSGTRTSRYATDYLEGLVGVLVRFTATLYEPQMLYLAMNHDLTSIFVELLMKTSSDEVQRLSATGLENLSSITVTLSRPPSIKSSKFMGSFSVPRSLSIRSSRKKQIRICPIHKGVCSSKSTFCLVEANAIAKLLTCLQTCKVEVVEAALSAICTLMDEKVDVKQSISMLSEMNTLDHVLNAVKEHKKESLRHKAFWMIEKFLTEGGDKHSLSIAQDRMLPSMLVSAFHHGDDKTRQIAENILRLLDKMPSFSTYFT